MNRYDYTPTHLRTWSEKHPLLSEVTFYLLAVSIQTALVLLVVYR